MMPRASQRLQLHAGFTFDDAQKRLPYYAALGVSHLYLSPITRAVAGSLHGYDVIDYTEISPELGGESALRRMAHTARAHGIGLIADIVPNHMAAHPSNAWWRDVLARGVHSRWAKHFDIHWQDLAQPAAHDRILLPILPAPYEQCLRQGKVTLGHEDGTYHVQIGKDRYPIADGSIPPELTPQTQSQRHLDPREGWQQLDRILSRQHYRLADWRTANEHINWRRFFDVNTLIGMRMECDEVFNDAHRLILSLVGQGVLDGLRIDHVDGLASPGAYLRRLREQLSVATGGASQPYVVVEKILAPDETIDVRWSVDGTTGYDFLDEVSGLLHDPESEPVLRALWEKLSDDKRDAATQLIEVRKLILARHFGAERRALMQSLMLCMGTQQGEPRWRTSAIDRVMTAWLAVFPVYRTYAEDGGASAQDRGYVLTTQQAAGAQIADDDSELLEGLLARLYFSDSDAAHDMAHPDMAACRNALVRLQQLTPPLAGKALEDTLFYRYGPLLSRNEVGASPRRGSMSPTQFHAACARRLQHHPHAMVTTATHDHKRGEDARARLMAISEIPHSWHQLSERWLQHWPHDRGQARADRYMLLQTLVGAWPLDLMPSSASPPRDPFDRTQAAKMQDWLGRVEQWQEKALREAKVRTSWADPDLAVETALREDLSNLSRTDRGQVLLRDIASFAHALAPAGMVNSLAQVLLRNTVPGMPDLYQGADLWDFSLVDPDNRRDVDYELREYMLRAASMCSPEEPLHWRDGRIKQTLLTTLLQARKTHASCFSLGSYIPLRASGPQADHVVAYIRRSPDDAVLAIAPRLCATRLACHATGQAASARAFWADTVLHLPADAWTAPSLYNALDGSVLDIAADRTVELRRLLSSWPVGLALQTPPPCSQRPPATNDLGWSTPSRSG